MRAALDAVHALEATTAKYAEQAEVHAQLLEKFRTNALKMKHQVETLLRHLTQMQPSDD